MPDENPQAVPVAETQQEAWTLITDGSSPSNNEAEYEALIAGLRIAVQMGVQNVHAVVPYAMVKMCLTAPVAMDYFTKRIEAKAVATITGGQSNGLVERANQSLGEGIMACLGERNKNWVEELPHVLWAHRIMIKSSHVDTPLSLTYGTEAVIPVEIGMPTYRTAAVDASCGGGREARTKVGKTLRGKELDLSNLGEAASLDISVCLPPSTNRIARPCGATVGTNTGTPSDLA
nr:reverse transcriptase domain-containing protein [Tanacetum cinerariifolium]